MKSFLKLPYCVSLYLPIDAWAVLCALFGIFLVFSRANFEKPIVLFGAFLFFLAAGAIAPQVEYGLFRIFGIKFRILASKTEREDAKILNRNIIDRNIQDNLSIETLKKIFFALTRRPAGGVKTAITYAGAVIILTVLAALLIGESPMNIFIILISGLLSTLLLALFCNFFTERFIAPTLKQCEKMLIKRGEKISAPQLFVLRNRFNYFALLLALVATIILFSMPHPPLSLVFLAIVGIAMVIIVSRVLFSSIYDIFLEIRTFVREFPKKEKTSFFSGSLAKEVRDLADDLNWSAKEIYEAREKEKKDMEEIEKRKADLERFYKLTVGRELKMMELKKKIKELEEKAKKKYV